jgi:hypothetical protein
MPTRESGSAGNAPEHGNDVLFVETDPHLDDRPQLQWTSPIKLQLTIPNKSLVGLHKGAHEGVEIVGKRDVAPYDSAPPNPR